MTPYVMTLTFLTVISLLTSSEMVRYASHSLEHKFHKNYLEQKRIALSLGEQGDFENYRNKTPKQASTPKEKEEKKETEVRDGIPTKLGLNLVRPPNNSRINLHFVLTESGPKKPKGFSLYELTATLIRRLYGETSFFLEVPNAEYLILDGLKERQEETAKFLFPDELASISFDDPQLQAIFYKMLKGTMETPSLLRYITFDRKTNRGENRKINLMFADPLLLEVVFENGPATEQVLALRTQLFEEMLYQEDHRKELRKSNSKNRTQYKAEFKECLEAICVSERLDPAYFSDIFDFSLGKLGTIIYLRDPSGTLRRQKHTPLPE